ncbi:MAG TPA: response regulator [Trichormus sp.]|jgi:DNA-binding NarL/FixJ family response regulator
MNRRHARAGRLNAQNSANGTHRLPLARSNASDLTQSETDAGNPSLDSAVDTGSPSLESAGDAGSPSLDSAVDTGSPSLTGAGDTVVPVQLSRNVSCVAQNAQNKLIEDEDAYQEKTESKKPKCIICQRTELVGAGYAALIKDAVDVVGYTSDGQQGVDLCRKLQPALLITDMDLANIDGLELCRTLSYEQPSIKLLLLSDPYSTSRYYSYFLKAGVGAFCLLTSEPQSLLDAIDRALKGEHYFDEKLRQWISANATRNEAVTRTSISKEFAVAELIARLALSGPVQSSIEHSRPIND